MMHGSPQQVSPAKSLAVLAIAAVLLVVSHVAGQAQSVNWGSEWDEIKKMYYRQAEEPEAVNKLAGLLATGDNTYSDKTLTEMLDILRDYFERVDDPRLFEDIVFNMLTPRRTDRIVDSFQGSRRLFELANRARDRLSLPTLAVLTIDEDHLDIGDSTGFSVAVYNEKDQPIAAAGLSFKLTPEGFARLDPGLRRVVAERPGRVTLVVSDRNGRKLDQADITIIEVSIPVSADVRVSSSEIDIGETLDFRVSLYDEDGERISSSDVVFELQPSGLATIDHEARQITGRKPGTVSLILTGPEGQQLDAIEITVVEKLNVSIEPEFKEIQVGQSSVFLVESNKSFDEAQLSWALDSDDAASGREIPLDGSRKRIEVTTRNVGIAYLRVTDGSGTRLAQATIDIRPIPIDPPSRRYSWISTAAFGALGITTLVLNRSASDKLDEWNECRLTTGDPCTDLGDDYNSKLDQARIFGVLTVASALTAGYFWYKYYRDNKSYKREMSSRASSSRNILDVGPTRVTFIRRF